MYYYDADTDEGKANAVRYSYLYQDKYPLAQEDGENYYVNPFYFPSGKLYLPKEADCLLTKKGLFKKMRNDCIMQFGVPNKHGLAIAANEPPLPTFKQGNYAVRTKNGRRFILPQPPFKR